MKKKLAFTLTELLVVISIIAVVAGLLMPVINESTRAAKITTCMNNMKQFSISINIYRNDFTGQMPMWLSQMEDSLPQKELFICPLDETKGLQGGRPDKLTLSQYSETNDINTFTSKDSPDNRITKTYRQQRAEPIDGCSYMYEFVGEECSWYDKTENEYNLTPDIGSDKYSWRNVKLYTVNNKGEEHSEKVWDETNGWVADTSSPKVNVSLRVPIVRCFWHGEIVTNSKGDRVFKKYNYDVMNLRWDGSINKSPPDFWWIVR